MKTTLKISAITAGLVLSGCTTQAISTFDAFQAENLNDRVKSGELQQKVDNLLVIVDASSSMGETYQGSGLSEGESATKLAAEKELLNRMNQTIPEVTLASGIRSFGFGSCMDWGFTKLNKSLETHSTASFASGIDSIQCSNGGSPMGKALTNAGTDLSTASGNIAVLILSDGHQLDSSPIPAAQDLKQQYGDRLCIYSVWIGGDKEQSGHYLLQQLSDIAGCGFVTDFSKIASGSSMAAYVERMLFNKVAVAAAPADSDGDSDGVIDLKDECPNTPGGAKVDQYGCWAYHGVFFDFDKTEIKPEFIPMLSNAAEVFNLNPGLTVEIQGHTDNVGSFEYNRKLSEKRARTVKQQLINYGVDPKRITSKGFGMSDPIESNDTEYGRAQNRRVYFQRTDQ